MNATCRIAALASALALLAVSSASARTNNVREAEMQQILAGGYPTAEASQRLKEEAWSMSAPSIPCLYRRGRQVLIWGKQLPAAPAKGHSSQIVLVGNSV